VFQSDITMRKAIYWVPGSDQCRVAIMPRPRGGDWLDDEMRSVAADGVAVLVCCLTSREIDELELRDEPASAHRAGMEFIHFTLADRGIPQERAALAELLDTLMARMARGDGIAIHCRAGIRRASLIAACLLVAGGSNASDAFDQIAQARGVPVPDTDEQRSFVEAFAQSRAEPGPDRLHEFP
jgi:protein-tyrosine phosphatase